MTLSTTTPSINGHYAKCRYAEYHILFIVTLSLRLMNVTENVVLVNDIMLNVVMVSVVMLSVVAPKEYPKLILRLSIALKLCPLSIL